tara:strand:+ start:2694 stop:2897 length:204 start_codon:yes stop_codon:yes gene_type:complete
MKHSAKSMVMKREFRSRVVKDKTKYDRNKSYLNDEISYSDIDVKLTGDDEPVDRDLIADKYQNGYWE